MSRKVVMQRSSDEIGLFSLATFQTLRLEALDLLDRSLGEAKPELLERFLERQVAQEPPPLELLSQIAEDMHQRLLTLRQHYFEARDHIRLTIQPQYGFDLSLILPADPMEYQPIDLGSVLNEVVGDALRQELADAAQLYLDVTVADQLYRYVMDWLMALHVVSVRGAWADDFGAEDHLPIH